MVKETGTNMHLVIIFMALLNLIDAKIIFNALLLDDNDWRTMEETALDHCSNVNTFLMQTELLFLII